jgi:hypothetical protein
MTPDRTTVTLKDIKAFLQQFNCQVPKTRLKEVFNEANNRNIGELSFDGFASLCQILTYDGTVYYTLIQLILNPNIIEFPVFVAQIYHTFFKKYSTDEMIISLADFREFLLQQDDTKAFNDSSFMMATFMREFVRDPRHSVVADQDSEGFFTAKEFISYLFSHHNQLFDPQHKVVNQDMNQPLSHYWIASSHNTLVFSFIFK